MLLEWLDRFRPQEKGPKDLVTEADLASQEAIREVIHKAFPDHDFLSEEEAAERRARGGQSILPRRSEYRWIVDPLDGTTNYVHRLPGYAVSIALQRGESLELGVVYDPLSKDCFVALKGRNPTHNENPISASGCREARQALVAVSFSPHVTRDLPEIKRFIEILLAAQSVRRMGSAALNLCYVAAGWLDAYVATSVNIWDVAAGLLLVELAGGSSVGLDGQAVRLEKPELIAAGSPALAAELLQIVSRAQ